jgi:hypothetical protein
MQGYIGTRESLPLISKSAFIKWSFKANITSLVEITLPKNDAARHRCNYNTFTLRGLLSSLVSFPALHLI